jgi:putative hydrolase of the HAD superfamily
VEGEPAITTVLFDAGGTLVHLDYRFLQQELHRVGLRVTQHAIRQAEYMSRFEIDRNLFESAAHSTDETRRRPYFAVLLDQLAVDVDTTAHLVERLEGAHAQDNLWRVMLPSTPRVLERLRGRGFTLGVISNADGRITSLLRQCGIQQFFDVIIDSHIVGVEKPDPRIFQLALEQVGARSEQALFIGDIYSIDVVGAKRAGLRPVLLDVLGGYVGVPCKKIRHLRELLSVV